MKYKNISENNGGYFILGIQAYNKFIEDGPWKELHLATQKIMGSITKEIFLNQGFIDFNKIQGIQLIDSCHTTQNSVDLISSEYVNYIYKNFKDQL